ncbi:MAG: LysR family transcriptional regulator [Intestinibacter sp.]
MTFEQLKSFLAVVKHNHFTLASQELFISQSSISKHIKALEKEIGIELFKREHRTITLTPAGEEFLIFAKKSVDSYDKMQRDLCKYKSEESEVITIGVIDTMIEYGLAALIGDFHKEYPSIHIELIERGNNSILEYLSVSKFNLAFVNDLGSNSKLMDSYELFSDNLVMVTSESHRFLENRTIALNKTSKEKYISLSEDPTLHNIFLNVWGNLNFFPNISYIDSQTKTLLALVSENMGVTLLPDTIATSYKNNINSHIKIINLYDNFYAKTYLVNIKNKKLSKNETLFKNFALKWFDNQSS